MRPWVAGLTFGLGVASGLFVAHETEEASHRYVVEELSLTTSQLEGCHADLKQAEQLLDIQDATLHGQLKSLESVCSIVRRAVVGWPWCPPAVPASITQEEDWKR